MSDTPPDWPSNPDPEPSYDPGAPADDQFGTDTSWSQAGAAGYGDAPADDIPAPEAAADQILPPPPEVPVNPDIPSSPGLPTADPTVGPTGTPTGGMGEYRTMLNEVYESAKTIDEVAEFASADTVRPPDAVADTMRPEVMAAGTDETAGMAEAAAEAGVAEEGGAAAAAEAVGEGGAVLGAEAAAPVVVVGAAGVGAGYLLATDTRVGETTTSTVGAIDQALSTPGQESWLLGKDEERQQAWDQGEYGTAGVDAVEEGAVGLAGAVGGLAAGAESAAKDYAGMAWDVVTDTDPDS